MRTWTLRARTVAKARRRGVNSQRKRVLEISVKVKVLSGAVHAARITEEN